MVLQVAKVEFICYDHTDKKKTLNVQIFNSEISIKKCISMYAISCGELLNREDKQLTYFKFLFFIYIFMTFLLQFSKLVFLCLFTRSHSHSTQIVIHNSYLAVIICNNLTFHSQMHSLILLIKEISINDRNHLTKTTHRLTPREIHIASQVHKI